MKFYFMPLNIFGDIQKKNVGFRNVEKSSFSTPPILGVKKHPFLGGVPKRVKKPQKCHFPGSQIFVTLLVYHPANLSIV